MDIFITILREATEDPLQFVVANLSDDLRDIFCEVTGVSCAEIQARDSFVFHIDPCCDIEGLIEAIRDMGVPEAAAFELGSVVRNALLVQKKVHFGSLFRSEFRTGAII